MPHDLTDTLIRQKLRNYLAGKTSLQAFRRWFIPATWDVEESGRPQLRELVYGIKLRLAEYSNGHWSKTELREQLLPFVADAKRATRRNGPVAGRPQTRPAKAGSATKGKRKPVK